KPEDRDPPNIYKMAAEDDPADTVWTNKRYFDKKGAMPRRTLLLYPSGRLASESDIFGTEYHTRRWTEDGREHYYLHGRHGTLLRGWSIGPDGERQRLKGGYGELVVYGRKAGNRVHAWYSVGSVMVEKRFLGGKLIQISLAAPRPDVGVLHVSPEGEVMSLDA